MLHFTVTSPERKIRMMNLKSSAVEPSCWEKETVKSKAAWIYKIWTNKNKTPVRSYRRQMCLKCSLIIKSESFLTIRHFAFSLDEREILVFSINQEQKKKKPIQYVSCCRYETLTSSSHFTTLNLLYLRTETCCLFMWLVLKAGPELNTVFRSWSCPTL